MKSQNGIVPQRVGAWAPRTAIAPSLCGTLDDVLTIESNGSEGCYGGWALEFPIDPTHLYYTASIKVRWDSLKHGMDSLEASVHWERRDGTWLAWQPLRDMCQDADGWIHVRGSLHNRQRADRLTLRLLIRWSPTGRIEWKEPQLIVSDPPAPRRLRIGAASSVPTERPTSVEENVDRILDVCRKAGEESCNLLCLPETILSWRLPSPDPKERAKYAVEIPGPWMEPFSRLARTYRMAIGFSVDEKADDLVYNTGVLFDESGTLIQTYRKVHLAIAEAWRGTTPGDSFSVAELQTCKARVGMNICMDSSSSESARTVARLGGEILLLPIMGDWRAQKWERTPERYEFDLERWCMIQQMRALDNQIVMVAARNQGIGTGIFSPDGRVLALDTGDTPLVWADVDLNDVRFHQTGPSCRDVTWFQRRETLYGPLSGGLLPQSTLE